MIKYTFLIISFLSSIQLYAFPPENIRLPYDAEIALANRYSQKAKVYYDSLDYDSSLFFYKKAAQIYRSKESIEDYVNALTNIGGSYTSLKGYSDALSVLTKALTITTENFDENKLILNSVYYKLSLTYYHLTDYSQALYYLKKIQLDQFKNARERDSVTATVYHDIGTVYLKTGKFLQALRYYQKSLKLRLKILPADHSSIGQIYGNMGVVYRRLQNIEESLNCDKKALKIRLKSSKPNMSLAASYNNIGLSYLDFGNYSKAKEYYQKSLDIRLQLLEQDDPDMAVGYVRFGTLYLYTGDFPKALEYYKKVLNIRLKAFQKDHPAVANSYRNLGAVYWSLKNYEQALNYMQTALDLFSRINGKNSPQAIDTYGNMGIIYLHQGNYTEAVRYLQGAIKLKLNIYDDQSLKMRSNYRNMSDYYKVTGNYISALEMCLKALDITKKYFGVYHPTAASDYKNIGGVYDLQRNYFEALNYYQKALVANVQEFNNLNIYINPQLKTVNSKLGLIQLLPFKAIAAENVYNKTGKVKDIKLSFNTSLLAADLIDSLRNENFSINNNRELEGKVISTYETGIRTARKLYQLTGKEDYLFKAFNIAERSKSYVLLQSLKETEAKQFAGIPDSLLEQERDLKIEIAFYEKQLFEAESEKDSVKTIMYQNYLFDKKTTFRQLNEQLEKEFPDYYRLKYDTRVASVKDIRDKLIDDHTAFLEYFWGDSAVYVFTVTKKDLQLKAIKQPLALREKIDFLRSLLMTPPDPTEPATARHRFTTLSRELYQILMPEENTLAGIEKLIIIPDGPLSYLPFDMLLTQSPTSKDRYSTLPYLIRDYDVSYGYSATLLQQNAEKPNRIDNTRCLAFAPSYEGKESNLATRGVLNTLRGKNYTALPGAQREVERLSGYLEGEFHFGQSATEENFKHEAKNYGILHLAMHGTADSARSGDSKLIFTPSKGSKEDGLLYTYELYNLKLNAEMAVLSACQSGTGQYVRGEGVISLARGFMYAGVRSVIMTLWDADDKSSAALTDAFYGSLLEGKQKSRALREAKLHYLQTSNDRLSHPFYWAGYSAFGDMKPLSGNRNRLLYISFIIASLTVLIAATVIIRNRK